jgi:hypothetical protein
MPRIISIFVLIGSISLSALAACSAPAPEAPFVSSTPSLRDVGAACCPSVPAAASSTGASWITTASWARCAATSIGPKEAAARGRSRPAWPSRAPESFASATNAHRASSAPNRRPTAQASSRGGVSPCAPRARPAARTTSFISTARAASNAEMPRARRPAAPDEVGGNGQCGASRRRNPRSAHSPSRVTKRFPDAPTPSSRPVSPW